MNLKKEVKSFSVRNVELFDNDDDVDFALAEIWALSEGNNSHHNPIKLDILKRDAHTMLGKFLLAPVS